jgi:hypothetical protein
MPNERGASPNVEDNYGYTPLMCTAKFAPGAVKFLLEWSTPPTTDIDIHIANRAGVIVLDLVGSTIDDFTDQVAPQQVKVDFLLQQWREIEYILVERGGSH